MVKFIVENLGHRFGKRILFRKMDFTLEGGIALAITGSNGSGKSTLVRILAGVLQPGRGSATLHLDGHTVPLEDRPLHCGMVAPYLNVYDGFSAKENLQFLARARRLPNAVGRISEVLELVSLAHRADDYVGTYSSGLKQRVRFAAALLSAPPVLLLDEPGSNLDAVGRAMVDRVMEYQRSRSGVLIVATNEAAEAARCERILSVEDYER